MTKVVTIYNNFAQGEADHDFQGRFDLPLYSSSVDYCRNFLTDYKGNAFFRTGLLLDREFQDCALYEFKFSENQNYIIVAYNQKFRFLTYDFNDDFVWVESGGSPLEVTTPYSLAESKELVMAQNADVVTITHPNYLPRELTRTSASSFTIEIPPIKGDPWALTFASTQNITAITKAANAQITITGHGYTAGERVVIESVTGMTEINDYTATVVSVVDGNNFTVNIDSTNFSAYTSGGTVKEVLTTDYPAVSRYYKGRRYFANSTSKPTTVWGSEAGIYDNYKIPTSITSSSSFAVSLTDIAEQIEWLFGGDNSLIAGARDGLVAINSGDVTTPISAETIEGNLTSADGSNDVQPLNKDGYIFYVGKNGRRLYFFNYDILSESFLAKDSNLISYEITLGKIKKIARVRDKYDFIFVLTEDGALLSHSFYNNGQELIRGWHRQPTNGLVKDIVSITDNNGSAKLFALVLRDSVYYIERLADFVEFKHQYDFDTGVEADDTEAYQRFVADQLLDSVYLDNSSVHSDLKSTNITYDASAGTITASASVFVFGDVGKQIVYKTNTGYESGRFEITAYNSGTSVDVDVLQTPTTNTYNSWYLTFNTITGLTRFANKTVFVVSDGAFLGEFDVDANGDLELPEQVSVVVVGYNYKGVLKSFPMGFQSSGRNTQTTMKALSRIGLRCSTSLGGKFGTSLYDLEKVQKLRQGDLNYLPAAPIDVTEYITITDEFQLDKCFYIVQDEPLPFNVNCVMIEGKYTTGS